MPPDRSVADVCRQLDEGYPAADVITALLESKDELLRKANVSGQMLVPRLQRSEVHALLDVYGRLDEEGRAGAEQVLALTDLDPVAQLRIAKFKRERATDEVPERTPLLEEPIDVELWSEQGRDALPLLTQLLRRGAWDRAFAWARQNGNLPALVRAMDRLHGAAFALAQMRGWLELHPALWSTVLPEMARFGLSADAELERVARSTTVELRFREQALIELGRRAPSVSLHALRRELLGDAHAALRESAARDLLGFGDRKDREEILEAFLAGAFREHFSIHLNHADLPLLERAARTAQGPARLRLVQLVASLEDPRQIPLLVELWKTGEPDVKAMCRHRLRAMDAIRVLPFLEKDIDDGDASVLDLVGPLRSIPERLVARYERASDRATWTRFLERMSGAGALHAPGLADVLTRIFHEGEVDGAAVRLFVRLDDWSRPAKVQELASAIEPALAGDDREGRLRGIVDATKQVGVMLRIRVLGSIGRATDEPIVLALTDALLENPLVRDALPAPMLAAVERKMKNELNGAPERVRGILEYLAARAKTDTDRRELMDVLERSLHHRSPRVRLRAHRLLRTHADRPRYLAATCILLRDPDPTTVRSALRVVAFGGYTDAIPEMADLLFHSHPSVRSAAREGLIHLGKDAVSTLTRAIGRARPDRRPSLIAILDEIER